MRATKDHPYDILADSTDTEHRRGLWCLTTQNHLLTPRLESTHECSNPEVPSKIFEPDPSLNSKGGQGCLARETKGANPGTAQRMEQQHKAV